MNNRTRTTVHGRQMAMGATVGGSTRFDGAAALLARHQSVEVAAAASLSGTNADVPITTDPAQPLPLLPGPATTSPRTSISFLSSLIIVRNEFSLTYALSVCRAHDVPLLVLLLRTIIVLVIDVYAFPVALQLVSGFASPLNRRRTTRKHSAFVRR